MENLVKVDGFESLRKDKTNGGVINVDKNAYKAYLISKSLAEKRETEKKITQEAVGSMQSEINNIKQDITEIKTMLLSLLNSKKAGD
jgi:hypothetical protein